MFKKKWVRVLGLVLATIVALLALFVVAFIVNPFEGSLADMRDVVPRDVDFFLRKRDFAQDFAAGRFPEPGFWAELAASEAWRQFETGPLVTDLRRKGIEKSIAQLRDAVRQIKEQSSGMLDVVRDVLGREVELAGRFKGARLEDLEWCAYLRVSWRAIAACNLAGFGFVQEAARKEGTSIRPEGDLLVLEPQGGKPIWLARHLDCVIVSNSKDLVTKSYALATSPAPDQEPLGRSSNYIAGVQDRLAEWQKRAKVDRPNALEVYLRPDEADKVFKIAQGWPNADAPDMNERVLASFIKLQGWRFLSGALVFEGERSGDRSLSALATVDLNRTMHTPFQLRFFEAEAQDRKLWLDPFLTMVPGDSCACAALRMPPGEFLKEMFRALEPGLREILNNCARNLGNAAGMSELIEKLQPSLQPRTGFVFRRNIRDKEIPVVDLTPVPQIAWVFWTVDGTKKVLTELVETLQKYREALKVQPWKLSMSSNRQADSAYEFWNDQIPGTGEFAMMVFDKFFILSNSGPLIRDMFNARFGDSPSITGSPTFKMFEDQGEIPSRVNGFVYLQGRPLQVLLEDYQASSESRQGSPDPEWMRINRARFETEVFEQKYKARFGSTQALDPEAKAQFRKDVDAYIDEQWSKGGRSGWTGPAKAAMRQWLAFSRMFSSACITVNLDAQSLRLAGRMLFEYR